MVLKELSIIKVQLKVKSYNHICINEISNFTFQNFCHGEIKFRAAVKNILQYIGKYFAIH